MAEALEKKEALPQEIEAEDAGVAQFLTFSLLGEIYGVDILRVQEIRGWEPVTRIPNAPPYVKGVLNLRGSIVPIFDLRERFNLSVQEYTKDTVVIVLAVNSGGRTRSTGVVVDAVSDVVNVGAKNISRTPHFGGPVATEFISSLASVDGKMIMLLEVDKLLGQGEVCEGGNG